MGRMLNSLTAGWVELFQGSGRVANPDPGNEANAPADPAVVTGNYQFIIPQMFDGVGSQITDIPVIPPFGQDWGQYAVNTYGLSGLTGGGSTGNVPQPGQGGSLYFDPETDSYYDLNLMSQMQQGG